MIRKRLFLQLRPKAMAMGAALAMGTAHSNNIQITNAGFNGYDLVEQYVMVQFDLAWENSWRTSATTPYAHAWWDAAWVFVKYKDATTGLWHHARLHGDGHSTGTGPTTATITTGLRSPNDAFDNQTNWGMGAFVHRSANGTGPFAATGVELRWNYGDNGVAIDDVAEVRVLALEMVYVSEGDFYVGTSGDYLRLRQGGTPTNLPFLITTEGALSIANNSTSLWGIEPTNFWGSVGPAGTLPAAFPKGYGAYYSMKHPISQQGYVDFLNTLTRHQQSARFPGTIQGTYMHSTSIQATPAARNGVRLMSDPGGSEPWFFGCDLNQNGVAGDADDGQWLVMNWAAWVDVAAYLDWSGLRPMTELEYEKSARGPMNPVNLEFAWGTATRTQVHVSNMNDAGTIQETSEPANANIVTGAQVGPRRVGTLAKPGNTSRVASGAGYYGILDLSGSAWERTINIADGRDFAGIHGDGEVSLNGTHDVLSWPTPVGGPPIGTGLRGGTWSGQWSDSRVSDRGAAVLTQAVEGDRGSHVGGRGVRTAP